MAFFSGEYSSKVDAKGRLVLPARLKNLLPPTSATALIVTKGFENCLVLYPLVEWDKVLARLQVLSEFNEEQRNLQRNLLARSMEAPLDSLGRFVVPKSMLEYAGISAEVTVLGVGSKMEVWQPKRYEAYQIADNAALSQLAQKYLSNPTP